MDERIEEFVMREELTPLDSALHRSTHATLYSHFPTKVHLVASVVSEFLKQVADRSEAAAAAVSDGSPAYTELTALLRDIVIATATNQAAKAAAAALDADAGDASDAQRASSALQSIINQARVDGAVRSDLSINDIYLLAQNIPGGQPVETLDRWIDLLLHEIAARETDTASRP
ncbi:hypothetical protein ACX80L_15660 [Arthrobacter sp. MDT1-48-3]